VQGGGRISFNLYKKGYSNIIATDFVEKFVKFGKEEALKRGYNVQFQVANATALPFVDNKFDYVINYGVVISHLPNREDRIKVLSESFRVLKKEGILLLSSMNIHGKFYVKYLQLLMKIIRLFYNPYKYEPQALPRLGIGGKLDLLFFKPTKPQLYYYYPEELLYEVCSVGFNICEFISADVNISRYPYFKGQFYIAAKK
jgi:SAM-dependent methyltransferase